MKKMLVLAIALAAAPFAASAAEGVSHTYVEGGWTRLSINTSSNVGSDTDFDGGYIRGSVGFAQSYYVFGGYARGTNNDYGTDIDANESNVGVGWLMPMSERAELNAEIGYARKEIKVSGAGFSTDGARASVGVRGAFNPHFEGWLKANYEDGGDFGGDFSGTLGFQAKINRTWGIVGELDAGDGYHRYNVGVRASF
ncbi:autotransporter outer membrane beta-barrel domain-containing protein [Lysobacter sp. TY2-98]|uniref:outer membrane beta-barrel protein n=1 Tax=Lysobacter sp. TY2-98 TaxID=2290922 RepID=UPI000E20567E|nr:outer membrane beta-barrel protein [Lysobacter sp. TY2-98]AXK73335.1 autotransporter outer membrane beta-barrel domain-containing protein [Lysobacter sp. TY2-98]